MATRTSGRRRWPAIIAVTLLLLLAVAVSAWLARKPIVQYLATSWCSARDATCSFQVDTLDLNQMTISDLVIRGRTQAEVLTARTVEVEIVWARPFSPSASMIKLENPKIIASFDGDKLTLDGLEEHLPPPSSGTAASPQIDIHGGHLALTTPAGVLTGTLDANGNWPAGGDATFELNPAELSSELNHLQLEQGSLRLTKQENLLDGQLTLALSTLSFDGTQANNILLSASLADATEPKLDWEASIGSLTREGEVQLTDLQAAGGVELSRQPRAGDNDLWPLLARFTAQGRAGPVAWSQYRADTLKFDLGAVRVTEGRMDFEIDTEVTGAISPVLTGDQISLSFTGTSTGEFENVSGTGRLVATHAALPKQVRSQLLKGVSAAAPFAGHAEGLKSSFDRALSDFTTGASFRLDAESRTDWRILVTQTLAIQSSSGLSAIVTPVQSQPALTLEPNGATLTGVLSLKGGGGPQLNSDIQRLSLSGGDYVIRTGGLTLQPWRASGLTIGANLNQFEVENRGTGQRLSALGELFMDGTAFGVSLRDTRLFGGIDAVNGAAGWRVQTVRQECLGLNIGSAQASGDLTLDTVALNICPKNGRFIQQVDGRATGRVSLGDVSLPFRTKTMSGNAILSNAVIDWSAKDTLKLNIAAQQVDLPMKIGGRTLSLNGELPSLDFELASQTRLTAMLAQATLSGELVPANITIAKTSISGQFSSGGFVGSGRAVDVLITDNHPDPYYLPLRAAFDSDFNGTHMSLFGPVSLDATGLVIADARLDVDLLTLNGTGQVRSRDLLFTPRGLQPKHLSDRARALLTNGRGALTGVADIVITNGQLTGTGEFLARDFGFDTLRVGSVDEINGRIFFSDILALTTAPSQQVSIGKLNLGMPLENGKILFQIINGREAVIEQATWPFAGGKLDIEPTIWTIAGNSDLLIVKADQIELAQFIDALSLPDIKAEGTISGTFPIELVGGNAFIRAARLTTDENGGVIKYTGTAGQQAGAGDERIEAAFTALRNFKFSVLEIGVDGNLIDDIVVSAHLLGKNPEVYGGAEFDFNISIDSKLAQLINTGRRVATSKWITEAIANDPELEIR
ncbi:MAG: YdbH domain-containing protein [Henriciella sp.]|nr:YdbH domain-containing protein [Henriciella sp.]